MSSAAVILPVIDTAFSRGSSGKGYSYYKSGATCGRKAQLDAKVGQQPPRVGSAATRGTIGHALLEIFYNGETPAPQLGAIQVADIQFNEDMAEAQRLVNAYCTKFPEPDFWGEVVGVEHTLPATDEDAQAVHDFFKVELTARLDLVVRTKEAHVQRIFDRTGLMLNVGINIIDHKFKPCTKDKRGYNSYGKSDSDPNEKYALIDQFVGYPLLWSLLHSEECVGMVANSIIGTKEVGFQHTYISPPMENDITGFREWLQRSAERIAANKPERAACLNVDGFNRVCAHYKSGACGRF